LIAFTNCEVRAIVMCNPTDRYMIQFRRVGFTGKYGCFTLFARPQLIDKLKAQGLDIGKVCEGIISYPYLHELEWERKDS